jgi:hypothetical protein
MRLPPVEEYIKEDVLTMFDELHQLLRNELLNQGIRFKEKYNVTSVALNFSESS